MDKRLKIAADVSPVREVTLVGEADGGYWRGVVEGVGLKLVEEGGGARIQLISAEAKFMGVRFREVSVSVQVTEESSGEAGAYLLQAFNSVQFFAFCERFFFKTPYAHGEVEVETGRVGGFRVRRGGAEVLKSRMGESGDWVGTDEGWTGKVFLPGKGGTGRSERWFCAEIIGAGRTRAFREGVDEFVIGAGGEFRAIRMLGESQFRPKEWVVRENGQHIKTKTYRR